MHEPKHMESQAIQIFQKYFANATQEEINDLFQASKLAGLTVRVNKN